MKRLAAMTRRRLDEAEALRQRVRAALPELARVLFEEFGARRVTVFGSVVTGFVSDEPDLDLLVEGVPPERLADARARLSLLSPLPVDLVPAEWGRPEVVQRAREDGEELHAAA